MGLWVSILLGNPPHHQGHSHSNPSPLKVSSAPFIIILFFIKSFDPHFVPGILHFLYRNSYNPCKIPTSAVAPHYQWENWGTERISNLSKASQVETGRRGSNVGHVALVSLPLTYLCAAAAYTPVALHMSLYPTTLWRKSHVLNGSLFLGCQAWGLAYIDLIINIDMTIYAISVYRAPTAGQALF